MTRDELQLELRKINERKEEEIRKNERIQLEIQEQYKQKMHDIDIRRHNIMQTFQSERLEVERIKSKAMADERVRYRMARLTLEDERQQLFADYKAMPKESGDTQTA